MSGFVSERTLIKRLNRKLADADEKLKTARSERDECDLGRHFIVDAHTTALWNATFACGNLVPSLACWAATRWW
jgi:hypothetical protein